MEKYKFSVDENGKSKFEKIDIEKIDNSIEIKMGHILVKYPIELKQV